MKKYLIYSTVLAVILFIGSLIALVTFDLTHVLDFTSQRLEKIKLYAEEIFDADWTENFITNLAFESQVEGDYSHESQYTFLSNNINIETELVNADVKIEATPNESVDVKIQTSNPERYRIDFDGSELLISEKKEGKFCLFGCGGFKKAQILITIPTEQADLYLETINGDISVILHGDELESSTINGTITVSNSEFNEANLNAVNGKLVVEDSVFTTGIEFEVINGDVRANRLTTNELSAQTTNGDVTLNDINGGEISTTTINGDFNWHNIYVRQIEVEKLNGEFKLVNDDLSYQIQSLNFSSIKKNHEIEANILNISYN